MADILDRPAHSRASQHPLEYHWVVVGGGLQGCYFAALLQQCGGAGTHIAILDPQPRLLHRWLLRSQACCMGYMRSTSVHHLAPEPGDLRRFARAYSYGSQHFTQPYLRPSLALFNAHSAEVLRRFRLGELHCRGELIALQPAAGGWRLDYRCGASRHSLHSQNVLLALGDQGEEDSVAAFGPAEHSAYIGHLSALDFSLEAVLAVRRQRGLGGICLLGGGISAAHLALALLRQGIRVELRTRHPLRCFQFDSDPGWLRKSLPHFWTQTDLARRWDTIVRQRHKGSMPSQLYRQLLDYQGQGRLFLTVMQGEADRQTALSATSPTILASTWPLILATGLRYRTPPWLLQLAKRLHLPLQQTADGPKPALRDSLAWAPGLYLSGRLGELFLGPAAGNIAGARLAAHYLPGADKF